MKNSRSVPTENSGSDSWSDFKRRTILYRVGVVLGYLGCLLCIVAYTLPQWFSWSLSRKQWAQGEEEEEEEGIIQISVGLWFMCANGFWYCRPVQRSLFPSWFLVVTVSLSASLLCSVLSVILITVLISYPSLSSKHCPRLVLAFLILKGICGLTGASVLGSYVETYASASWLMSLVASLLALFTALFLHEGQCQQSGEFSDRITLSTAMDRETTE